MKTFPTVDARAVWYTRQLKKYGYHRMAKALKVSKTTVIRIERGLGYLKPHRQLPLRSWLVMVFTRSKHPSQLQSICNLMSLLDGLCQRMS